MIFPCIRQAAANWMTTIWRGQLLGLFSSPGQSARVLWEALCVAERLLQLLVVKLRYGGLLLALAGPRSLHLKRVLYLLP
jgi:hypothetical protein